MTDSTAEENSKSKLLPGVSMTSSFEVPDNKEQLGIDKGDNQLKSWPYMTFGTLIKSLVTKAISFGLIWGVGYMNWNFAWLIPPIAFVVLRGERKKDAQMKRLTAQATALSKDKIIIENRIDELPIWVYFPDYDRAEWLNGVIFKLWPSINQFTRNLVKSQIQETIAKTVATYQKKIPGLGKDFTFDRVVLGRIPPKINGVKVYDKHTSRNEIILDMDIMYAGDCDIAFTMGTIKGGIKDFQLRGMLRVVLKPLIPVIPMIGGVQAFFLNCPILDFNLVGIADLLDFPGFNDIMRKIVAENVAAIAVLPNKITVKLSEDIPTEVLKTPEPEGVLRIHVVQAKHLMKKDIGMLGKGKSDPYAIITVGAQEFRTQTIDNTVDPQWDYWCETVIDCEYRQEVNITLWDWDPVVPGVVHDFLGRYLCLIWPLSLVWPLPVYAEMKLSGATPLLAICCLCLKNEVCKVAAPTEQPHFDQKLSLFFVKVGHIRPRATVEVSRVKKKGILDTWLTLELAKHGMVHLRLSWLGLSSNSADLASALMETQELRVTSMSSAILILYVDCAKNLPCLKGSKQPDVYLEARIDGKVERTTTQQRSSNPVWEQGFVMLVTNPETGTLHIEITDEKTHTMVGTLTYNLSALLSMDNMQMKLQPFDLQKSGTDSRIAMSMSLRILKNGMPEATSEDEEDEDVQSINKRIERQESTVSSTVPDSPFKRHPSKESVRSSISNTTSAALEDAMSTKDNVEGTISAEHSSSVSSSISRVPSIRHDSPGLIRRNPSQMSFAGEAKLGRIQLTLKYSMARQKLMIIIHKIANLPLPVNDPTNIPDPYVKVYLLPDRHKESKRKTAVKKDNCNPVFDEQFEYIVSQGDINSRILEFSICTQKGWLSTGSKCMGQVLINLSELDFTQSMTSWYDLQPESKD